MDTFAFKGSFMKHSILQIPCISLSLIMTIYYNTV